jgi:hypothetical protein
VAIIDSHGRVWRLGTVGVAIGIAGVPLVDMRGNPDLFGYHLRVILIAAADNGALPLWLWARPEAPAVLAGFLSTAESALGELTVENSIYSVNPCFTLSQPW